MLHRLADGLRRFFKFSAGKNRLKHKTFAQVADGLDGKEKKSEQSEPIGEPKSYGLDWDALRKMTDTELIANGWRKEDDCWMKPVGGKYDGHYIFSV